MHLTINLPLLDTLQTMMSSTPLIIVCFCNLLKKTSTSLILNHYFFSCEQEIPTTFIPILLSQLVYLVIFDKDNRKQLRKGLFQGIIATPPILLNFHPPTIFHPQPNLFIKLFPHIPNSLPLPISMVMFSF